MVGLPRSYIFQYYCDHFYLCKFMNLQNISNNQTSSSTYVINTQAPN